MAQHLLVAADRFQLGRLRRICERRLCETVEVHAPRQCIADIQRKSAGLLRVCCAGRSKGSWSPSCGWLCIGRHASCRVHIMLEGTHGSLGSKSFRAIDADGPPSNPPMICRASRMPDSSVRRT